MTSFVVALAGPLSGPVQAQTNAAQPAVQELPKPIGKVVAAAGSVTIQHTGTMVVQANVAGQPVQAKIGDLVYLGDVALTGADGRLGINFADGSSFTLSSNARMALDEFVYDPNSKSNASFYNLTRGTAAFVAGNVAKTGDMKVDTPVATMGIRGTTPHIEIAEDGSVRFSTLIEEGKSTVGRRSAPAAPSPGKDDYLKSIELCNGASGIPLDARIDGCTAIIHDGQRSTHALTVAHNNRGNAYAAKGDYDRAIQDFDQSIRLNGSYAKPFNNRGVAYLKKGEYDLAIEAFGEAIKRNPDYGEAFANRAATHLKKNAYDRAAQDYDEAIRLNPTLEAPWTGRCWTRAVVGPLPAALEDCNKALASGSNNAAAYDSRGLIQLKLGQFNAAVEDFSSALGLDPKLASALYGRGLARRKLGDEAGSNRDIVAAQAMQAGIGDDFTRYGIR
jgi:tetratricopeptide (TPR) repeat protein